jgi:hypothetical protein
MGAVSKVQNVVDQPNITTMELVRLVESAESTKSIDFNDMETAANDHHHHHHHHVPDIQQYFHQPTVHIQIIKIRHLIGGKIIIRKIITLAGGNNTEETESSRIHSIRIIVFIDSCF